jgi:hypothetical protein
MKIVPIIIFLFFFQKAHAKNESFLREEVRKISSYFVKKGCNIDGLYQMTKDFGFEPQVKYGRQSISFEKLNKSELCLISRSYVSDMRLYALDATGNINTAKLLKYVESKYPSNFKPNYLLYKIPTKMALKCDDNAVVSTVIVFKKFDGKITREIRMNLDRTRCNVGDLGLPKDFDN